ncbi:major capsid family protein, partial [Burkholderia multivorans]
TPNPLTLWGMQIGWTIPELESAQKLGRPVDQQKFEGMQLKHNMDVDEQVYIGDTVLGVTGLVNSSAVENVSNAQTGNWASATPDQMLDDVNEMLNSAWAAAGYAVCPSRVLLDPTSFSLLVQRKVSDAGNISVLSYLQTNSLANQLNGRPLEIFPSKWLTGRGA